MQSQNQAAQLLALHKHTSFSFQSHFPLILLSPETAKMVSDCNCRQLSMRTWGEAGS